MLAEDHTPPKKAGNEPFANWVKQKEKKKRYREKRKNRVRVELVLLRGTYEKGKNP